MTTPVAGVLLTMRIAPMSMRHTFNWTCAQRFPLDYKALPSL